MEHIVCGQVFDEERALYNIKNTEVKDCTFAGPADGESVLKETRNIVLHEGDFWSVQLFNSEENCGLLSSIQTNKKYIKDEILNIHLQYCDEETRKYFEKNDTLVKLLNSNGELLYSFDTTLDYQKFIAIFVRACINFITNYIRNN